MNSLFALRYLLLPIKTSTTNFGAESIVSSCFMVIIHIAQRTTFWCDVRLCSIVRYMRDWHVRLSLFMWNETFSTIRYMRDGHVRLSLSVKSIVYLSEAVQFYWILLPKYMSWIEDIVQNMGIDDYQIIKNLKSLFTWCLSLKPKYRISTTWCIP